MIFYTYGLKWKKYETLAYLPKDQKSDFEMNYCDNKLYAINGNSYSDFQKNNLHIMLVTKRMEGQIEICAVTNGTVEAKKELEHTIAENFHDCTVSFRKEVTGDEFRTEVSQSSYTDHRENKSLFEQFHFDLRNSFFDPVPFKSAGMVLGTQKITKSECKKRAKEILASKSFYEEIDRMYSKENRKEYFGHPVHYYLTAGDWQAARDMYELLVMSLYSNKRLVSTRIMTMRQIERQAYKDERLRNYITASENGIIVVELKNEDAMGRFATDFHEMTKVLGTLLEQQKKDTLFIFVEISGKSVRDNDAVNNILSKADFVKISEGSGTPAEAKKYLTELVSRVTFPVDNKEEAFDFLPNNESYTVTDIFNAYNAWHGSGLKNHIYKAYKDQKSFKQTGITKNESTAYQKLQEMIGLYSVKTLVDQIIASSKMLRVRERMGFNTDGSSLHMLFSGNPGTAKTTVARLLTEVLKDEDAITSGAFVECGRQDLVGKYVGWTAPKVEEKFKAAMGGVLFIDEAYSLVDDSNTYGAEAINAITQMMENYRNDVIVIFAGYPDKMEEFLNQNEGLKSRIAFHLDFPDYSADELTDILKLMAKNREYSVDEESLIFCKEIFEKLSGEENFGNGRCVRNVLEKAILKQANRIVNDSVGKEFSKEDMCRLIKDDFSLPDSGKKEIRRIGFE